MHGLIFEISISRLAGSTRYPFRPFHASASSSEGGSSVRVHRTARRPKAFPKPWQNPLAQAPIDRFSRSSERHSPRNTRLRAGAPRTTTCSTARATKAPERHLVRTPNQGRESSQSCAKTTEPWGEMALPVRDSAAQSISTQCRHIYPCQTSHHCPKKKPLPLIMYRETVHSFPHDRITIFDD